MLAWVSIGVESHSVSMVHVLASALPPKRRRAENRDVSRASMIEKLTTNKRLAVKKLT